MRTRPRWPRSLTCGCTRIWPKPTTKTGSAWSSFGVPASGIPGPRRLVERPGLAGARHTLHRRRDRGPWHRRHRNRALPGLEHDPGVGVRPVPALESAGAPVGLAVDGSASNDQSNMIQEVRNAFLLQRIANGAAEISHIDALRWATAGSAQLLGRDDIGTIAAGKAADLALFTLDEPRFRDTATRWRRWSCAVPTPPTGSWSPAAGWSRTARSPAVDLPALGGPPGGGAGAFRAASKSAPASTAGEKT